MGHFSQDDCWERHPRGSSFGCLWPRKLEKEMAKALERENCIFGTFIYENKWKLGEK